MEAKRVSVIEQRGKAMQAERPTALRKIQKAWASQERGIVSILSILAFLVFWEVLVTYFEAVDPLFVSAPSLILAAGVELVMTGALFQHTAATLQNLISGFVLAAVAGIFIGVAMGRMKYLDYAGTPFVDAFNAVPRISFLPLIIVWFGIGMGSKVVLVFLSALFPILINAFEGVRSTDQKLIEAAKAYGAKEKDIFLKIVLQASVPFIVSGLRQGIGRAIIGVIVAEFFASNIGLGYLIQFAGATFQTGQLFVAVLVIAAIGMIATYSLRASERRIAPWLYERHAE